MKTPLLALGLAFAPLQTTAPAPGPAYTSSGVAAVNPAYQVYTIADPAAFKLLWLPYPVKSIILWNGLVIAPNFDYQTYGTVFQVNKAPVAAGDRITVVTFQ